MAHTADGHADRGAPGVSSGAVWLKGQLLDIASALRPARGPVVAREWTDSVRLGDPAPVGYRSLFLVGMSGDGSHAPSRFGETVTAFAEAGWEVRTDAADHYGESWATARREDFEARVYEGSGSGILTLTGWTPVVYLARQLGQPPCTRSTADGVLCDDCHGWGVCLMCEGRPYRRYERCWCAGNNAGPGRCVECAGSGLRTVATVPWYRPQQRLTGVDREDVLPRPRAEAAHDSTLGAFADVARRACACGEVCCFWRNAVSREDGHLLSLFAGACQGCGEPRAYAFTLPLP
ncbi:hypothetical protein OHA46_31870 [Streptomyces sp. NBC_00708]